MACEMARIEVNGKGALKRSETGGGSVPGGSAVSPGSMLQIVEAAAGVGRFEGRQLPDRLGESMAEFRSIEERRPGGSSDLNSGWSDSAIPEH